MRKPLMDSDPTRVRAPNPAPPEAPATPAAAGTPTPRTLACRTVLVPLDGSAGAERALPTATWLAERLGARLDVVAAEVGRDELWWYRRYVDDLRERCLSICDAHVEQAGSVADAVARLAVAGGPTIVCMATHGRGRTAALLGSTFADVAAGDRPLVAVGPHVRQAPAGTAGTIVACVDGTEESGRIVPEAAVWARRLGMAMAIVTVAEPPAHLWLPPAGRVRAFGPADPTMYLASLAASPELAGLEVATNVVSDPVGPDVGLFRYLEAHPATLLALGTRGRRGLTRALHGSEAARIVHGSPVPALVHRVAGA